MQHDTPTNTPDITKSSDKKSFKINLAPLGSDNMTDEIDKIFYGDAIHCTEVKHSTSDDYE